jgi:hypothetical protein
MPHRYLLLVVSSSSTAITVHYLLTDSPNNRKAVPTEDSNDRNESQSRHECRRGVPKCGNTRRQGQDSDSDNGLDEIEDFRRDGGGATADRYDGCIALGAVRFARGLGKSLGWSLGFGSTTQCDDGMGDVGGSSVGVGRSNTVPGRSRSTSPSQWQRQL